VPTLPRRLSGLPAHGGEGGAVVLEACGLRARLLGLAFLRDLPPGVGLLIPRCRSVHTFGMRFAIDVVFLDEAGAPLAVIRALKPRRVCRHPGAASVLEARAG
jgi:uncharacterized membrane protein (UPF0127 family)